MDHECIQKDNIQKLMKWVDGNGKPGLRDDVTEIKSKLDLVIETLQTQKTRRFTGWQIAGIIMTAIIGASGVAIKIIETINKS